MSLLIPFPFWVAAEQKGGQVELNISLVFLHWVWIALHPWPFVYVFVLNSDIKLQLTNCTPACLKCAKTPFQKENFHFFWGGSIAPPQTQLGRRRYPSLHPTYYCPPHCWTWRCTCSWKWSVEIFARLLLFYSCKFTSAFIHGWPSQQFVSSCHSTWKNSLVCQRVS